MKKKFSFVLLYFVAAVFVFAQQPFKAEGMGYRYDEGSGLFASHASLPFGTRLVVTNLNNGKQVTVQVGGRIPQDTRWIVDLSPDAASLLEMNDIGFTPVRLEEMVVTAVAKAPRASSSRFRDFQQNGRAVILPSGTELTAGHPSIAMGRKIQITNRANGRSVIVTVKNRVRASRDSVVEISQAAALALGIVRGGYADVTVESVDR
ncbi:MAG: septal ring lytic transglycosylase RlpA family protein [Treponema sp.]|nr:septal ring lytic transglycosylase RlpA family protein [Treponema sp.]